MAKAKAAEAQSELPDWYDEALHLSSSYGIIERSSGFVLAADGVPVIGPVRAARLAAAGVRVDALGLVGDHEIAAHSDAARAASANDVSLSGGADVATASDSGTM
jgi:hypothetical protein